MANDDYRIRIDIEDEHAGGLLERLHLGLSDEAADIARELESRRLVVSRDGDEIFVYAGSLAEAESARSVIQSELRDKGIAAVTSSVEHWIDEEDRWDDEPPGETWEEEELDRGYAPWEVRVECPSREEAHKLAEQLEAEGYKPQRSFHYLVVSTATREDADALAERLHGDVEAGGEVVWETTPQSPFAIFGGLAQ